MKKYVQPLLYILSLIACCIEIDISVPSFPTMVEYFNTTESLAQHTVSINFLGFFISALIVGPLADAYGRRPIMIIGNAFLMIGALGCVWAPAVSVLLIVRFVQGAGAATSAAIVFAMITDAYKGKKATQLIGLMNCILTCLMAASPVVGSYLNEIFGWRGTYIAVAIISIISWGSLTLALAETNSFKKSINLKELLLNTKNILKEKAFLQTSIAPSLLYGAYLSFITYASFLYMQTFKLPMYLYAIHQALIITVFALVSLFSGILLKYINPRKCLLIGITLSMLGALAFLFISLATPNAMLTTATISLFSMGFALFYPVVFTSSLEIFPKLKGSTSSIVMAKRAIIVALVTWETGNFYNGSPIRVAIIMVIATAIACFLSLNLKKQISNHDNTT